MPGIVGFVTASTDQQAATARLLKMQRCMLHEEFYTHGTYVLPEYGCYVGWVTHKNSYADCNPIVNRTRDVALIFSGEHFSHDTRRDSGGAGGCGGLGSAASLLRLYEEKGEQFLLELNGWFAGVLIDLRQRSVLLFNDRFGVQRVYYHEGSDSFTFASEAKSVLSVCPETRTLDQGGLGQFIAFGNTFDRRTLFANMLLLPAASCWSIAQPSALKKRQYFHPSTWAEQPQLDAGSFYTALRDTLGRIVPTYFRDGGPVGVSLTAGLDTRIVMAGIPADSGSIPCYTYAGIYRECLDVQVARQVATACGQSHHVLPLKPDFFTNFETVAERTVWLTDGCLGLTGAHEIYYSKMARQLSQVRLTGNYGSEILRSVSTFKYSPPPQSLFDAATVSSIGEAAETFAEIRRDHPVSFAAFKQIPWNLFGLFSAAQSQLVPRSPYMDNALVGLLYQAPPHTRETNETSRRLIADRNPALAAIPTDMGYLGHAPVPIARGRQLYRYLQFKAEWYYNAGMPQWVVPFDQTPPLKALEPLFLGRHKIDHYRLWFQGQLKGYLHALLADGRAASRPYLNRRAHDELVKAHQSGRSNSLNAINRIVTLELVHRLLLERDYGR